MGRASKLVVERRLIMRVSDELTKREWEVLTFVAKGLRNAEIAQTLSISEATVETHLHHVFDKLCVSTRTEAAVHVWLRDAPRQEIQERLDDNG
jgi:DNA-binding NarL/FixJ family response regulator